MEYFIITSLIILPLISLFVVWYFGWSVKWQMVLGVGLMIVGYDVGLTVMASMFEEVSFQSENRFASLLGAILENRVYLIVHAATFIGFIALAIIKKKEFDVP